MYRNYGQYRSLTLTVLLCLSCAVGCAARSGGSDDEPVRYANSVSAAMYDTTRRAPVPTLEVFQSDQELAGRPHHVIALLSREGYPRDEGLVMNAIAWRARHLGAGAMIVLPPYAPPTGTAGI